jgi:hypothetical protein
MKDFGYTETKDNLYSGIESNSKFGSFDLHESVKKILYNKVIKMRRSENKFYKKIKNYFLITSFAFQPL